MSLNIRTSMSLHISQKLSLDFRTITSLTHTDQNTSKDKDHQYVPKCKDRYVPECKGCLEYILIWRIIVAIYKMSLYVGTKWNLLIVGEPYPPFHNRRGSMHLCAGHVRCQSAAFAHAGSRGQGLAPRCRAAFR